MAIWDVFRPKWKRSDSKAREEAVIALTDQDILGEIALTDKNTDVRVAAIARLKDQDRLAELASRDLDTDVRVAAVNKLKDQDLLAEIALNDGEYSVQRAAVKAICDKDTLVNLVRGHSSPNMRSLAARRSQDNSVMYGLLLGISEDKGACCELIHALTDPSLLREYIADLPSEQLGLEARSRLIELEGGDTWIPKLIERMNKLRACREPRSEADDYARWIAESLPSQIGKDLSTTTLLMLSGLKDYARWVQFPEAVLGTCNGQSVKVDHRYERHSFEGIRKRAMELIRKTISTIREPQDVKALALASSSLQLNSEQLKQILQRISSDDDSLFEICKANLDAMEIILQKRCSQDLCRRIVRENMEEIDSLAVNIRRRHLLMKALTILGESNDIEEALGNIYDEEILSDLYHLPPPVPLDRYLNRSDRLAYKDKLRQYPDGWSSQLCLTVVRALNSGELAYDFLLRGIKRKSCTYRPQPEVYGELIGMLGGEHLCDLAVDEAHRKLRFDAHHARSLAAAIANTDDLGVLTRISEEAEHEGLRKAAKERMNAISSNQE